MNINFTIVVQAINFFIGFLLLKYLLFKPALKYLLSERRKKKNMEKNLSDQQNLLDSKMQSKSNNWKNCQKYFQKHCPKNIEHKPHTLKKQETETAFQEDQDFSLSTQEIKHVTKHVEKALIERLQHVKN